MTRRLLLLMPFLVSVSPLTAAEWKIVPGRLTTRWAQDVSPERVHPEYPRPQLVRRAWQNLNGLWDYALTARDAERPATFDGQILVPFPIESALSGVMKPVSESQRLWYRREFVLPADWSSQQILLHFGAVDWEATVWVNGQQVGEHRGGYDPFTCNITRAIRPGKQELIVRVWDPTDRSTQPRGKQVQKPHSIWYTSVTGIWQTVWLEPVAERHIRSVSFVPDVEGKQVRCSVDVSDGPGAHVMALARITRLSKNGVAEPFTPISKPIPLGKEVAIDLEAPRLWSPDEPWLYDVEIRLSDGEKPFDSVTSYFGMRSIALGKDDGGRTKLLLNGRPLFQYGPLDQGWWPDGLYTAPTDDALRYDIEVTKRLGCNMCRKHVKVEPDRWYYWCDKLGLLVWQDMPSGDKYIGPNQPDIQRTPESARQFETELRALIDSRRNHPSIVMWVPFNEGWGQYDTARIAKWVKELDPTRLVNSVSGWADRGVGDVHDIHVYPGPGAVPPESSRAAVLGEFGGLGLPLRGHTWQDEKNWGYRSFDNAAALTDAYVQLIHRLRPLIDRPGLSAAVYTQTTDVEIEVNGWLTYDRAAIKPDAERVTAVNRLLYLPPPMVKPLVPTSQSAGIRWRYTTTAPDKSWSSPEFDDASWQEGEGGFGRRDTPGAVVRTEWTTNNIWLRRTFELPADFRPDDLQLAIHHDEDAEVFVNGQSIAKLSGFTVDYLQQPLDAKARAAFRPGKNVLAVSCKQTTGGQYIDAGFIEVVERK